MRLHMSNNMMQIGIQILCLLIGILTFFLLMAIGICYHPERIILRTYQEISNNVRSGKWRMWNYGKINNFLIQNGASFHFGKWIDPIRFMAVRLITSAMGFMIGIGWNTFFGIVMAIIFWYLPNALLIYLNNKDNDRLLPELKLVYNALAMQIRAGVYVTDALAECYGSVQEKRLRTALLALSGDIVMKADLDDALESFQQKFDNRYIDSLCITIQQAMESGQAIELLADIAEQIKDMEAIVLNRKKGALDRSITFYQLGVLAVVLVIVLYACITHIFTTAVSF